MSKINFRNRLLSLITAGMMFATPVAANADGNENENANETSIEYTQQIENRTEITVEEYNQGVKDAYNYLSTKINYDNMLRDLKCLYYLTNYTYISDDVRNELIDNGDVFGGDDRYNNMVFAYNLINEILNYNQKTVREANDINELVDASVLCSDKYESELVHSIHVNYFNAYKGGRFYNKSFEDNESYAQLFNQLTTLNTVGTLGNAHQLTDGSEWMTENIYGVSTLQMLYDHIMDNYSGKEITVFFDPEMYSYKQLVIRTDAPFDNNRCVEKPDLEAAADDYRQLYYFSVITVNNNILNALEVECSNTK